MPLQKHKIYIAVGVILISLTGLAIIQISWLNKSIVTNKQIYVQNMDRGTQQAGELFRSTAGLASTMHRLINENKSTNSEFNYLIKPFIDSALKQNKIPSNYEYGVYRHKGFEQNELVFGTTDLEILESLDCNKKGDKTFGWTSLTCNLPYEKGNSYHLAIFPSYTSFILNKVKYSLFAFILFLVLISFGFYSLLQIINKQKKISEIKNDFINNLTHEFKTPIFSMSLASKAIRQSLNGDGKLNSYIDVIDNESNCLKRQVDKILQLSLVDSERFQLQKQPIDIQKQLEGVIKNLKLVLDEKSAKVNTVFKAENAVIWADETHLKNVWHNILDNALKYNKVRPIITIKTVRLASSIQVSISDNGIGITLDKQQLIFDKFYRVSTGNIHETKGFGIGLSYVKRIIELHNGHITIISEADIGTTFKIELLLNEN